MELFGDILSLGGAAAGADKVILGVGFKLGLRTMRCFSDDCSKNVTVHFSLCQVYLWNKLRKID